MELMEYDCDSDPDPDLGASESPMQHSGWEPCQKVLSYVNTIAAFRRSPTTEKNPSYRPVPLSTSEINQTLFQSSKVQTPKTKWNMCKNVFSAVNTFSGFRSVQDTLSPQDRDVSDGEDYTAVNNNVKWFTGTSGVGHNSSESRPSMTQSVSSFFGGMFPQGSAANSEVSDRNHIQNVNATEMERDFSHSIESCESATLPGNKKLFQRFSMQVESPARPSPKRLSLDPSLEGRSRRKSLPPNKMPRLSESADRNSHNSSLRSLCKPAPAKRRKTMQQEPPDMSTEAPSKIKLFTFKSFLLLNVVIGICLSVYIYKLNESMCSSFTGFDSKDLTRELNSKVYGQHIATELIPNLLEKYLEQIKQGLSPKPLVLSLHGWTGVGKNHVSKIVSNFFHYTTISKLLIPLHFAHEAKDEMYAQQIPEWISTNITKCHVNFVIFDEMDKASDGVITGLNNSVRSIVSLNATSMPVIFLLLSNSKGAEINKLVFHLTSNGRQRESIKHDEILPVFETDKPLWYKKLIPSQTIDAFVPFLPLEKEHIVQCIKNDLTLKGLDVKTGVVTDVVREMSFYKLISGEEFSHTGCKRVSDKVNLVYNVVDPGN